MSGRNASATQFRYLIAIGAALFFVTVALYLPTAKHDFVNYDDGDYVTGNAPVQGGLNRTNVVWAFTTGHASNWHPLTWISHMMDCQFYGLNAGGHHVTSLLIHATNAVLLFAVLFRMTGAMWPSAFVAALFAWHPVHVESVAWVSERKDVLSTFFWLLTMLAYQQCKMKGARFAAWYALALFFFVLGLLSKPMVVTLPFALLLVDWWVAKMKPARPVSIVPWKRLVLEKIPFLVLAGASAMLTFEVQRAGGSVSSLNVLPVGSRIANAFVSYLRYAGKVFWPENLSVMYPYPGSWPAGLIVASVIFVLGISVAVILLRQAHPYLLAGWFWFLGTLIPVIGLVQVGVQSMADRYTYIPAIGLFIMVAWGGPRLVAGRPGRQAVLSAGSALSLAACLMITTVQIGHWQDGETLFRHVLNVTRDNYLAYNNLGFYLYNHGKSGEAMACYKKSVAINPNYEEAQNNLGHALNAAGRVDEAIMHLETALRIKPSLVAAHNNLGNALSSKGRLDAGIAEYQEALRYDPDDEDAHNNLGIARAMQGRLDEALQLLTRAVQLKPSDAGAHSNRGNVLAAQHKLAEAAKEYQVSLKLDPVDSQAWNNLGNLMSEQGKWPEAAKNYEQSLKLRSENPEANYNLGIVLLREGKVSEAKNRLAEAVRLKPDYAVAKQQLDALEKATPP